MTDHTDENLPDNENRPDQDNDDLKQNAIKYKAFQHTFSNKDIDQGINEKSVLKKLKKSQHLESSYENYLKSVELNPLKPILAFLLSTILMIPLIPSGLYFAEGFVINSTLLIEVDGICCNN